MVSFFKVLFISDPRAKASKILTNIIDGPRGQVFYSMYGVAYDLKIITSNHKFINFLVWDTSSQGLYEIITCPDYRDARGVILIYDVSTRETFELVKGWMN